MVGLVFKNITSLCPKGPQILVVWRIGIRDGQGGKRLILLLWCFLYNDVPSGEACRVRVEWTHF